MTAPMKVDDALEEARRRWGPDGWVRLYRPTRTRRPRVECWVGVKRGARFFAKGHAIRPEYVGGNAWTMAFEDADRRSAGKTSPDVPGTG